MKYFIDTEFIEGFHKPLFGKRRHFIDLISIGIYAEDGRTYYAISTDFNPNNADDWVKENVISKLPQKNVSFYDSPRERQDSLLWKCNKRIAKEIREFVFEGQIKFKAKGGVNWDNPEIYAYYADYDWVVFCSLFGRMIDLPHGFPMYCKDLKQSLDEAASLLNQIDLTSHLFSSAKFGDGWQVMEGAQISKDIINIDDYSLGMKIELLKSNNKYPKQTNVHNALADAKWNFELYKFLTELTP